MTLRLTVLKTRLPGKAYPPQRDSNPLGDIWTFRVRSLTRSFSYFAAVWLFSVVATCPNTTLNLFRSATISALAFVSAEVFSS